MPQTGELYEEITTTSCHIFEDDILVGHDQHPGTGEPTGIFWFVYRDGRITRRYSEKTAPKWLLRLYREAIDGGKEG